MSVPTSEPEVRARAWLLFNVRYPKPVAKQLNQALGLRGEWDFVVVRADVVRADVEAGCSYNIVVPVDAKDEPTLAQLVVHIMGEARKLDPDVSYPVVLRVVAHNPEPPQKAHGYVTEDEHDPNDPHDLGVHRIPNSPGSNAWG